MAEKKKTRSKAKTTPKTKSANAVTKRKSAAKAKIKASAKTAVKPKTKPKAKHKEKIKDTCIKDLAIRVCVGTGGLAAGSQEVIDAFHAEFKTLGLDAAIEKKCLKKTGCRGFCAKDVLVDVIFNDSTSTYKHITPEKVERIVDEHIINGQPVEEWLVGHNYYAFHDRQTKIILKQCGQIDPEDINAYLEIGGYEAAKNALSMEPYEIIEEVKASGLCGRGGAGFPTGFKWELCRMSRGKPKYIICNADEGDPGAFMDRSLIEGNPHSVIEGMIIGAFAIGSPQGYVYIRAEYPLAVERLRKALMQAREKKILGKNILNSEFDFDIKIKLGAGAFVCGESTALMRSIEGKRGMPRQTPPQSVSKGLRNMPTALNNVETLANIPIIINRGADWFASFGTEKNKGTKVFSLTGKVQNTGLIEVPLGISLREIIYDIGGGMEKNRKLKAVQTGGPSGGCIPASHIDMPVDYESLNKVGAMMGSGGMVVMDDTICMVDMAKFFLAFTENESCGKCVPCRIGTKRMLEILTRITEGKGREGDIELLVELGTDIKLASLCGLGRSAPNPVLSTINFFRDEYESHIKEGICSAGLCKALRQYIVNLELCKMCGKCSRVCPSGAIIWETRQPAFIEKLKCAKCGACFDACPFKAII
ncbi:MAG: NADH-quinone oxidoreductase subunit NuoF [Thermodesulfovibrionia bacterium]|nr:NADH-quinone oxidoreductase subunit NuoF [Thermodesulfovibrionia bacterium]